MIDIGKVLLDLWNSSGFAALFAGFGDGVGGHNAPADEPDPVLTALHVLKAPSGQQLAPAQIFNGKLRGKAFQQRVVGPAEKGDVPQHAGSGGQRGHRIPPVQMNGWYIPL